MGLIAKKCLVSNKLFIIKQKSEDKVWISEVLILNMGVECAKNLFKGIELYVAIWYPLPTSNTCLDR